MTPQIANDLLSIDRYMSISRKDIINFIPYSKGSSPVKAFKVLITIHNRPNLTVSAIKKLHNALTTAADISISTLLQLGFIEAKNKPYWITAIHAWRVLTVYVITKQGEGVISKLFEKVYRGNNVVN